MSCISTICIAVRYLVQPSKALCTRLHAGIPSDMLLLLLPLPLSQLAGVCCSFVLRLFYSKLFKYIRIYYPNFTGIFYCFCAWHNSIWYVPPSGSEGIHTRLIKTPSAVVCANRTYKKIYTPSEAPSEMSVGVSIIVVPDFKYQVYDSLKHIHTRVGQEERSCVGGNLYPRSTYLHSRPPTISTRTHRSIIRVSSDTLIIN